MNEKLKRFLTMTVERSPVWLDEHSFAYLRSDEQGTHIWEMNLDTNEKWCRLPQELRLFRISAQPTTGDILYGTDESGSECEQLYVLGRNTTAPKALTNKTDARHFLAGLSPDGKTIAYASNKRCTRTFDIWKKNIETGEDILVKQHSDNYNWPADDSMSPDGKWVLYNKLKGECDNALWITNVDSGESFRVPGDDRISAETNPAWRHDSKGFYLLSNRDSEFLRVWYYDLNTKQMTVAFSYDWDADRLALSADDRYLVVVVNEEGYGTLHLYDLATGTELNTVRPPNGVLAEHQQVSWSPKGHKLLFTLTSGKRPEGIWLLDVDQDTLRRISDDPMLPEEAAVVVEPLGGSYTSFDGLEVPYWLFVPAGKKPENLSVVVEIHGGPEGQERPAFNAFIQYLVSEGFAVCAPNVRGSTGYGHTYTHLDDVGKRLDSVRDIDSLVDHLIKAGIACPGKLAVSGTSYGGFMTLSCASRYPHLWACAVDTVGMYNLVTFLENTAEYRRHHRESEYGTLEHDRELLFNVSPAAKIMDITAPLMVVQGRNDPRVPVTEAEQAVAALRKMGRTVEYICYDDEGHGVAYLKNKIDCYSKVAAFLKKYL